MGDNGSERRKKKPPNFRDRWVDEIAAQYDEELPGQYHRQDQPAHHQTSPLTVITNRQWQRQMSRRLKAVTRSEDGRPARLAWNLDRGSRGVATARRVAPTSSSRVERAIPRVCMRAGISASLDVTTADYTAHEISDAIDIRTISAVYSPAAPVAPPPGDDRGRLPSSRIRSFFAVADALPPAGQAAVASDRDSLEITGCHSDRLPATGLISTCLPSVIRTTRLAFGRTPKTAAPGQTAPAGGHLLPPLHFSTYTNRPQSLPDSQPAGPRRQPGQDHKPDERQLAACTRHRQAVWGRSTGPCPAWIASRR